MVVHQTVVPGSNPPVADCQSPDGLPPGMALGCGLTSVRGDRRENLKNQPLVQQKQIKKKKSCRDQVPPLSSSSFVYYVTRGDAAVRGD